MAKDGFSAKIESKNMERMFDQFQRDISARDLSKFVDFESGNVLVAAATKTAQAKVGKINNQLAEFSRVANKHNPEPLERKKAEILEKKRRIGLARQTWLYLGSLVGLDVSGGRGLGKARKASVDGRSIQHDGSAKRIIRGNTAYAIEVIYRNPVGAYVGARKAIASAIEGRAKFFRTNLKVGVFESAKTIAAKYPGIEITPK